jgi:hypothetical protein
MFLVSMLLKLLLRAKYHPAFFAFDLVFGRQCNLSLSYIQFINSIKLVGSVNLMVPKFKDFIIYFINDGRSSDYLHIFKVLMFQDMTLFL